MNSFERNRNNPKIKLSIIIVHNVNGLVFHEMSSSWFSSGIGRKGRNVQDPLFCRLWSTHITSLLIRAYEHTNSMPLFPNLENSLASPKLRFTDSVYADMLDAYCFCWYWNEKEIQYVNSLCRINIYGLSLCSLIAHKSP